MYESIGIVLRRQRDDAGVDFGTQEYFDAAHRGSGARGITVEEQYDFVCIAGQCATVVFGQRCARGGGHMFYTGLNQAN